MILFHPCTVSHNDSRRTFGLLRIIPWGQIGSSGEIFPMGTMDLHQHLTRVFVSPS